MRAFRLRLAAHYATVATFVPTDVDAHIRHHTWVPVADAAAFAQMRACVDEAAARDARVVSERVTQGLSGHDGEWLSVRAGALGRALVLGLDDEAAALAAQIDAELDREQHAFAAALDGGAPAATTLALATTIAHNLGDLSRVVDAWPRSARRAEFQSALLAPRARRRPAASRQLPARGCSQQGAHGAREPSVPGAAQTALPTAQPHAAAARRSVVRRVG